MPNIRNNNLDYLRAFAIIFVIGSHIPVLNIKSGAVNIFFVLTGYFIAKSLNNKYKNLSILTFYKDRFTNLLPKITLVGLLVYLLWDKLFQNYSQTILLKSFLTSSLGIYNFYLIELKEFYDNQKIINPFLPLWAFSLILQFYFIAPIALKVIDKFLKVFKIKSNKTWRVYFVITLLFFIWSATSQDPDIVKFYGTQHRIWEFFLGVLVYYLSQFKINELFSRDLFSIGVIGLVVWGFIPNASINNYLNIYFVVFFAALFILGSSALTIKKVGFMSSIGKSSFDSYILHYPLLFLFIILGENHLLVLVIYLISLLILTVALNRLFKFRQITKFFKKSTIFLLVGFLLAYVLYANRPDNNNLTTISDVFGNSADEMFENVIGKDGHSCLDNERWDLNCEFLVPNSIGTIFLVGTSQAEVFSESILNYAKENSYNFYDITKGGCPFLLEFDQVEISYDQIRAGCADAYHKNILKKINETPNSIVIYHTRMQYYLNGFTEFKNSGSGNMAKSEVPWEYVGANNSSKKLTLDNWRDSLQQLSVSEDRFLLIYPIPEFDIDFVPNKLIIRNTDMQTINYTMFKIRSESSYTVFDQVVGDNVSRIFADKIICETFIKDKCVGNSGNSIFYADESHLSRGGVELIFPEIQKVLDEKKLD